MRFELSSEDLLWLLEHLVRLHPDHEWVRRIKVIGIANGSSQGEASRNTDG